MKVKKKKKRGRNIQYSFYDTRKTSKRRKYLLFALLDTTTNVPILRVVYNYINNIYKRPGLQSFKDYFYWIWWLHPNIQAHYNKAYSGWLRAIFYRIISACSVLYWISDILADLIGGWPVFKYIVFWIILYAFIWGNLKKFVLNNTPTGQRWIQKYRTKSRNNNQRYLIRAVLKKNCKLVKYKFKHFYTESALKPSKQRWSIGKTNFKDYSFSKSLTCQTLAECLDVNNYIIKHHISYYRHDVVLDGQVRTLAEQESFRDFLLLGNTLDLLALEFKEKKYVEGSGKLVIKKIYANHCVYDHKTDTKNLLSSYILCWVPKVLYNNSSKNKNFCIPVLSLGPWVVDQKQKKPWYITLDKIVYKEAFNIGYRLNYTWDSMVISKSKVIGHYDIPYNSVEKPLKQYALLPNLYMTLAEFKETQPRASPTQIVIAAREWAKTPWYKRELAILKHCYFIVMTRYRTKKSKINFKKITTDKFAKKWDKKNPRLGRIFQWLEKDGRWYYRNIWRPLRWRLMWVYRWRASKIYPFIVWVLFGSVMVIFFGIIKGIPFLLKFMWMLIKRILYKFLVLMFRFFNRHLKALFCIKNFIENSQKYVWDFLTLSKNMRLPLKLKHFDDDQYLFRQVDRDEYQASERALTALRRMLHEKLSKHQKSDEHMLELRHNYFLGNIDRVIDENIQLLYESDVYVNSWSLVEAKYPYGKWEENKNWWHLSDVIEYRLLAEHYANATIYRENFTDQLFFICANMETNLLSRNNDNNERYATDLLEFFCVFPMVSSLESLTTKFPLESSTTWYEQEVFTHSFEQTKRYIRVGSIKKSLYKNLTKKFSFRSLIKKFSLKNLIILFKSKVKTKKMPTKGCVTVISTPESLLESLAFWVVSLFQNKRFLPLVHNKGSLFSNSTTKSLPVVSTKKVLTKKVLLSSSTTKSLLESIQINKCEKDQNYVINNKFNFLDNLKGNIMITNKIRQNYAKEDLVMILQKDIIDLKTGNKFLKVVIKEKINKCSAFKSKIVRKKETKQSLVKALKLNKIRSFPWAILKLYI